MRSCWIGILVATLAMISVTDLAKAQGSEIGKNEYMRSCASCHGTSGKGDGYVVKALISDPDLTKFSEANKGVFPFSRIYDAIDGAGAAPRSSRTREMPVWGEFYSRERKRDCRPRWRQRRLPNQ